MPPSNPGAAEAALPSKHYAALRDSGEWRIEEAAEELLQAVESTAARLARVDAAAAAERPAPDKWCIKEIVGHLIDSAANNHQRFVRGQYGGALVLPGYAQDFWVDAQGYVVSPWPELVDFWRLYNRHLARVMRRLPRADLDVECHIGPYAPVPLGFIVEDYVAHLKHHILQIDKLLEA